MSVDRPLVWVNGIFHGYTDIYKPVAFLVPVREFKPKSTPLVSMPVYWRGNPRDREFKIGRTYRLGVNASDWSEALQVNEEQP